MKIRTDFVTNSSSSSFCAMTVKIKDGIDIVYGCEDGATPPFNIVKGAEKKLNAINNIEQLVSFLRECDKYPEALDWDRNKVSFFESVKNIKTIEEVLAVKLNYGVWDEEEESNRPKGYGGSFEYDFKTKAYKESHKIDPKVHCPWH